MRHLLLILSLAALLAAPALARDLRLTPDATPVRTARKQGLTHKSWALGRLRDGDRLILKPGTYRGIRIRNKRGVVMQGTPGAVVLPPAPPAQQLRLPALPSLFDALLGLRPAWAAPQSGTDALFLQNVRAYTGTGLVLQGASRNGLYIEGGQGVTLKNSRFVGNRLNGALLSNASAVLVYDCVFDGSREGHGLYISTGRSDGAKLHRNQVRNNAVAGIQCNPESGSDKDLRGVEIIDNQLSGNGSRGSAALNLAAFIDGIIRGNRLIENKSGNIVLFKVAGGGASRGTRIENNTLQGGSYGIRLNDGSTATLLNNRFNGRPEGPQGGAPPPGPKPGGGKPKKDRPGKKQGGKGGLRGGRRNR